MVDIFHSLPNTYRKFSFSRCLHIISDSKHALVDSSSKWDAITHSSCKKRKVSLNCSNTSEELLSGSPNKSNETLPSFEESNSYDYGYKRHRFGVKAVKKAKNCLQSLKRSLENLHRENLFPYNPEVLLKRYVSRHNASFIL